MWRGHNREPTLESPVDKQCYLDRMVKAFKPPLRSLVLWHSYCLMTTHAHETGRTLPATDGSFDEGIRAFGNWMRNGHSAFGAAYNARHDRQGKVAYDRAKTKQLWSSEGVLRAMLYGDANPVVAGMVSHPARYPWSSHRFYAYGETNEWTGALTPPEQYLALGSTPEARQHAYRSMMDAYLREAGLLDDRPVESEPAAPVTCPPPPAVDETGRPRGDPDRTG
jgi:putative transposase